MAESTEAILMEQNFLQKTNLFYKKATQDLISMRHGYSFSETEQDIQNFETSEQHILCSLKIISAIYITLISTSMETIKLPDGSPSSYISGIDTYTFERWDGFVSGAKVTSDIVYNAIYIKSMPAISSDIYNINSESLIISRIAPTTLISTLKSNLATQYKITLLDSAGNQVSESAYAATGMILVLAKDDSESKFTLVVTGDTNGDGKASITDFIQIKTYLLAGSESKNLTGINEQAGDINEDGKISITDFVQFKSHLLGSKIIL